MSKIEVIRRGDPDYPELLSDIKSAPDMLYVRGDKALLGTRCIGIVGTRKPSDYGRWAAFKLAERLAGAGVTVVSGMATGIDTCAHKGALAAGGKTIAVFGCGIDICFPQSNTRMMEDIVKTGLVVSELPPGTHPDKFTFPHRNRIISGLSEGVIVIEAGIKSGSLITAECAAEQGRDVYALPGNINNVMSIGANKLIRDGAIPITTIDDVLCDMGLLKGPDPKFTGSLSGDELKVIAAVREHGELPLDMICVYTEMTPGKVAGVVTVLEMKGIVCSSLGKIFIAN